MKKTYKTIKAFIVLLSLVTFNMEAQLSGTVTINSGVSTGGTNYQTFNALATVLNTSGLSGPLVINVVASTGPYVEQVTFNQCTGMGSANRVTMNGNGNTLTFNSTNSGAPHTLLLNGADFMTVNDLNVVGQGATYALVCILTNNANYNTFNRCTFVAPLNGTSSYHIPFCINGSATSAPSGGNAGNYNTVNTSTLSNGYYGLVIYGLTSAPWTTGNTISGCRITDAYYYISYMYYTQNTSLLNNTFDRATRTSSSGYIYVYQLYNHGFMVDGNKWEKFFESMPGYTGYMYMYLIYYQPTTGLGRTTFRNNIITDMKTNYYVYMYCLYSNADIYNNTFNWDYSGTNTGYIYNLYAYSGAGYAVSITNNIITIRKGGTSGGCYGMYSGGVTGNWFTDKNDIVVSPNAGYYVGYYTSAASTFTAWQSQGQDPNGVSIDPMYVSLTDLHPTNVAINNMATPMGLVFDQQGAVRNQLTPDIGALEFLSPACVGTPTANSVSVPNYALCPGEIATLGLGSLNSTTGYTYQWQSSSISQVGPFTAISGATGLFYTIPPASTNMWYSVIMTCTNAGGGNISPVGQILVAGSTSSVVPCSDGFEGIGKTNRLPNCSWSSNSLGGQCQTYTASGSGNRVPASGTCFASFDNSSPGINYFYTNGITMNTGITYSAEVKWATEYFGGTNWTDLTILVGPNQNPTGMVPVASVGPAISGTYKLLGNTFTVPSTGTYYVAIRATSSAGSAQYLSIDDFKITIPCQAGSPNTPTIALSANLTTVCANQPVNLTASGADTYTWSTGANGSGITDNPFTLGNTTYYVMGSNALTGCTSTVTQIISVIPSPVTLIYANPASVCAGQPVVLTALGANSYVWSNGGTNPIITITPTVGTTINVIGTNANGCSSSASQVITVKPLPNIVPSSSNPGDACKDDQITFTANGGLTYQWVASTTPNVYVGGVINVSLPVGVTVFTVIGTNANGCAGKNTISQSVLECTGINKNAASLSGIRVYPNPTNADFTVELNTGAVKTIEVVDLTGRMILSNTSSDDKVKVNISTLANGIYYVKIKSNNAVEVIKVVKQ